MSVFLRFVSLVERRMYFVRAVFYENGLERQGFMCFLNIYSLLCVVCCCCCCCILSFWRAGGPTVAPDWEFVTGLDFHCVRDRVTVIMISVLCLTKGITLWLGTFSYRENTHGFSLSCPLSTVAAFVVAPVSKVLAHRWVEWARSNFSDKKKAPDLDPWKVVCVWVVRNAENQ